MRTLALEYMLNSDLMKCSTRIYVSGRRDFVYFVTSTVQCVASRAHVLHNPGIVKF